MSRRILPICALVMLAACNTSTQTGRYQAPVSGSTSNVATGDSRIETAAIPFLDARQRQMVDQDFALAGNKQRYTLAVSRSGSWAVDNRADLSSQDRARAALAKCQSLAGQACGLALVDGNAVGFVETPVGY